MKKSKVIITGILFIAFVIMAAAFVVEAAQQLQPGPSQPGPEMKVTAPVKPLGPPLTVQATMRVNPTAHRGRCPYTFHFTGWVKVNRPATIQYTIIRNDGGTGPEGTLTFSRASVQRVNYTWQLGGRELPSYKGWVAIKVLSPVATESNKAAFRLQCMNGRPGHPGERPQQTLPDLVIDDVYLDKHCNVVVRVKNLGPGYIPDNVWTDHRPESASVYLVINGHNWGGATIWKFDPGKSLQAPGGTATYRSNLEVKQRDAMIRATVDHTRQVPEANEGNNEMTKRLSCERGGPMPPQKPHAPGENIPLK